MDNTYIVFKAYDTLFAVDSDSFCGISRVPEKENIIPLTSMGRGITGLAALRNNPTVLVNLREYLQLPSVSEQYSKLANLLSEKRREQVDCFVELKKCAYLGSQPEKQTLDVFYGFVEFVNNYKTNRDDLRTHFEHIAKNYSKLKEKLEVIFSPDTDTETRERYMYEVQYFYIPKALKLIEEAKDIAAENYREVVILINCGEITAGLTADEVTSVEQINVLLDENSAARIFAVPYIAGVGKGEKTEKEIILLSAKKLSESIPTAEQIYNRIPSAAKSER